MAELRESFKQTRGKNCHDEVFDENRSNYSSTACVVDNKLITATLKQLQSMGDLLQYCQQRLS